MMIEQMEKDLEVLVQQEPKENEFILWRFDMDIHGQLELTDIHLFLKKQFPNTKVIGLPIDCQMHYFDKDEIEEVIKDIRESIKS